MDSPVWIVIPTYNEAANVERIARAVGEQLERATPDGYRILIVDDGSPDGTGQIADRLASEVSWLEVLHRADKQGLGQAYVAGFTRALAGGAQRIVQMDADFSHDPVYLGALLGASESADVVLGSRYARGGGVSDWGPMRRVISRGGGLYARLILGLDLCDPTAGFKCMRREVLERIAIDTLLSQGYVFSIEVTYRALLAGFSVTEVPIVFRDRRDGTSKMSARIALEAIRLVPRLRRDAPAALRAAAPASDGRPVAS